MSEWQPIETAPKDGTWVLCYGETQEWFDPYGSPRIFSARCAGEVFGRDQWRFASFDDEQYGDCTPTHWMPLPPPPSTGE